MLRECGPGRERKRSLPSILCICKERRDAAFSQNVLLKGLKEEGINDSTLSGLRLCHVFTEKCYLTDSWAERFQQAAKCGFQICELEIAACLGPYSFRDFWFLTNLKGC